MSASLASQRIVNHDRVTSRRADALDPWKVLIADDEPEVHHVTRLVLANFRFADRGLTFLSAYNSEEALDLLQRNDDVAVILLDVVMESEQAGLRLVRSIRERLGNRLVRIVLRTGQAGQAPEHEVIASYDINDYKEKTELTAQKLSTTMYAALRAFRDIRLLEANRNGLERVVHASAEVFAEHDAHQFAATVLARLHDLIGFDRGALLCRVPDPGRRLPGHFPVASAVGPWRHFAGRNAEECLLPAAATSLREAFLARAHVFRADHYALHFSDGEGSEHLLYLGENGPLDEVDRKLLELFCGNAAIAFRNLHLNRELLDSQLEMVHLLAGAAETRSRETANHVRRVGLLAEMLGEASALDRASVHLLRYAAPLHDIGKVAIPDAILNKPGPHTPEEAAVMRTHAEIGARLLGNSRRPVFRLASEIALTHHENWDGGGYPRGLAGDAIPLAGRITALADVFDALGSRRCYKEPWSADRIRAYIDEERDRKFDPVLVDLLHANWERALDLRRQLPD